MDPVVSFKKQAISDVRQINGKKLQKIPFYVNGVKKHYFFSAYIVKNDVKNYVIFVHYYLDDFSLL